MRRSSAGTRRSSAGSSAATPAARARRSAGRGPRTRRRRAHGAGRTRGRAVPRRVAPSHLQGAGLPEHWITKPGTSLTGGDADRRAACQRDLRTDPRRPATAGRTSGRPSWPTRSSASNFGENWISVDPHADYDETLARIQEVVDRYPGIFHDVQTYLNERIDEVLDGVERSDRRPHLRRRTSTTLQREADEVEAAICEIDGVERPPRRAPGGRRRRCRSQVDLAQAAAATGSSPATCAAPRPT